MKMVKFGVTSLLVVLGIYVIGYQGLWKWTICRKYCDKGTSLRITQKTGDISENKDSYANENEMGVFEQMKGPGRHFLNPWNYTIDVVPDIIIRPGEIGIVKNNLGKDIEGIGRFMADPGEKGTQKQVLTPGSWRINDYGQEVTITRATIIKPGYVGVQTLQETKGTFDEPLTPGYYNINPREIKIDIVEIGYTQWVVQTEYEQFQVQDEYGNIITIEMPKAGTGVSFPLSDGKDMFLDITVIWGIFPKGAPRIIQEYGNLDLVESKIIEPQVMSICKNLGSNYTTMEFIKAETREAFQDQFTAALQKMGKIKGIEIKIALVRKFHPNPEIQKTIQATLLAEEKKATLLIEQQRDKVAAALEQAERKVDIAKEDFDAETTKIVEGQRESGFKKAAELREDANITIAFIDKKVAEANAQAVLIEGQARADVVEAMKKAEAEGLRLKIEAYGGADTFNLATFADLLPNDLRIKYQYAGEGTLWTDPGANLQDTAAKRILQSN